MSVELETRVETLEALMADALRIVRATGLQVDRLSQEMRAFKDEINADTRAFKDEMRAFKDEINADTRAFKDEMRAFKDEMSAFKDEMRAFKDEINADTRAFKDEMRAFKDGMLAFKDEMRAFKEESRASRIEMNKRWGDLSASLGLLVENIVAPSIPRVLSKVFACPDKSVEFLGARLKLKHPSLPGRNREFDAVATGCGYVLIVESKAQLDSGAVAEFASRLPEAKEYFPELVARGHRFVGVVAGLYVDPSVVAFAEKLGLIVLGTADDLMQVLNSSGFSPKTF